MPGASVGCPGIPPRAASRTSILERKYTPRPNSPRRHSIVRRIGPERADDADDAAMAGASTAPVFHEAVEPLGALYREGHLRLAPRPRPLRESLARLTLRESLVVS